MREDGAADLRIYAALGENRSALYGMVGQLRVNLPVEIVQQSGNRPLLLVFVELTGIGNHAGFDGECVTPQVVAFREFTEEFPGLVSVHSDRLCFQDMLYCQ